MLTMKYILLCMVALAVLTAVQGACDDRNLDYTHQGHHDVTTNGTKNPADYALLGSGRKFKDENDVVEYNITTNDGHPFKMKKFCFTVKHVSELIVWIRCPKCWKYYQYTLDPNVNTEKCFRTGQSIVQIEPERIIIRMRKAAGERSSILQNVYMKACLVPFRCPDCGRAYPPPI